MEDLQNKFLEAYNSYSEAIFRFCFFKLNDRELAKDLMQDTFAKVWLTSSKQDIQIHNIKALIYKIAGNLIIDEYRKRGRRDVVASLDVLHEDGFDPSFDDTDSVRNIIDGKEAINLISKIRDPYGESVLMRYVQDLSISEIAEITGETENTISVRIHRGISILKKLYNHEK
ncbi:MAG: RNA polymerase sigma factor [Candidatus Pacebacteria bacterium]|nr:RNA polymerase sigma factor [Candidatus Paceibacterota bacterium]